MFQTSGEKDKEKKPKKKGRPTRQVYAVVESLKRVWLLLAISGKAEESEDSTSEKEDKSKKKKAKGKKKKVWLNHILKATFVPK